MVYQLRITSYFEFVHCTGLNTDFLGAGNPRSKQADKQ